MSVENSKKAHCFLDTYHGFTLERNRAKAVERNWEGRAQEGALEIHVEEWV